MTEADRLILRALSAYEADLCQCGHPRAQAWSPEHDPAELGHVAHYETGPPFRCFACTALARGQAKWTEAYGADHMAGAYWVTELVPRGKTLA
jgi:hypothetical protein